LSAPRWIGVAAAWALAGCAGGAEPAVVSTRSMAVSAVRFDTVAAGMVPGFDLDAHDTQPGDRVGCGKLDFTDPSGARGIDNQFATVFALADEVAPGAVGSLVQQNIDDGLMILTFSLEALDDDSSRLVVRSTSAEPLLGTDGRLLDGQTFDLGGAVELGRTSSVELLPGDQVLAGPFDLRLEIEIFARTYVLTLKRGFARFGLTSGDAALPGLIGGAVPLAELLAALDLAGVAAEADLRGTFGAVFSDAADLDVDQDACQSMSAAFSLEMVSVFAD
jgi:hypothetical protein